MRYYEIWIGKVKSLIVIAHNQATAARMAMSHLHNANIKIVFTRCRVHDGVETIREQ